MSGWATLAPQPAKFWEPSQRSQADRTINLLRRTAAIKTPPADAQHRPQGEQQRTKKW
jgi:hypothetical protein